MPSSRTASVAVPLGLAKPLERDKAVYRDGALPFMPSKRARAVIIEETKQYRMSLVRRFVAPAEIGFGVGM